MDAHQIRKNIQLHLMAGEIEAAINVLMIHLNNEQWEHFYDNALILKSKWEKTKQEQLKGILSREEYEVSVSKIIVGIQTIANDINKANHINVVTKKKIFKKLPLLISIFITLSFSFYYTKSLFQSQPQQLDKKINQKLDTIPIDKNTHVENVANSLIENQSKNKSNSKISNDNITNNWSDTSTKAQLKSPIIPTIDSTLSIVEAIGVCFIDYQSIVDSNRAQYMAERCAYITATRNLIEKLNGAVIKSNSTTENYKLIGDEVRSEVSGKILGIEQDDDPKIIGTRVEIKVKVKLN